ATSGCTATASVVVTQDITAPKLTLGNAPSLNCLTTSAQIFAHVDSGATLLWTGPGIVGGTTGTSITFNAAGTYTVVATGPNGCTATASVTVTQDVTAPKLTLSNAPALNCLTTSAQLSAQTDENAIVYWTGPVIVGAT